MRPLAEFGDVRLTELGTGEIAAWETTLPPRFRHDVVRALRQVLEAAVAWEYPPRNPAKSSGRNPAPPVIERTVLEPDDVDRLAADMRSPFNVAVIGGAWCFRNDENPRFAGDGTHAPGKIRTCDLCLRRAALYPLSYGRGEVSVARTLAGHCSR